MTEDISASVKSVWFKKAYSKLAYVKTALIKIALDKLAPSRYVWINVAKVKSAQFRVESFNNAKSNVAYFKLA